MGLGNVMQANGSLVRAASEFNLLKMEDMKRVRAGATITGARMKEFDAVAQEAASSTRKSVDSFFQMRSANDARNAAIAGFVSALAGAGSGIAAAAGSENASVFSILSAVVKGGMSALGAYFALVGAQNELELARSQNQTLSDEARADQNNMRALDGNPNG